MPEASKTLPPSAVSASAVARPKVPDAPVMMATLSLTLNSESGFRSGSEIIWCSLLISYLVMPGLDPGIHPHPNPPPRAGEGWEGELDCRVKPGNDEFD